MKLQMRTIDLDKNVCEHIFSLSEGSNMFNVVTLQAFQALLQDFPYN